MRISSVGEGATFAIVPYVNKSALGVVSAIVGAGGNLGAMLAGFVLRYGTDYFSQAYLILILGLFVIVTSFGAFAVKFSPEQEAEERRAVILAVN